MTLLATKQCCSMDIIFRKIYTYTCVGKWTSKTHLLFSVDLLVRSFHLFRICFVIFKLLRWLEAFFYLFMKKSHILWYSIFRLGHLIGAKKLGGHRSSKHKTDRWKWGLLCNILRRNNREIRLFSGLHMKYNITPYTVLFILWIYHPMTRPQMMAI